MKIPLAQFELHLPPATLSKGLDYFQRDLVRDCSQLELGHFVLTVEGTELYEVDIYQKGSNVTDVSCTCPAFADQSICKHIAASFFYLNQSEFSQEVLQKKRGKQASKTKTDKAEKDVLPKIKKVLSSKKTIKDQVMDLLEPLAESELKNIIYEVAKGDKVFRALLLSRYSSANGDHSIARYKKEVDTIIRLSRGNNLHYEWKAASQMVAPLAQMLKQARQRYLDSNEEIALNICLALISEIMPVFNYSDDSSGRLSSLWQETFEFAVEIVESSSDELRLHYIDFALTECFKGFGFDFGADLLTSTIEFIDDDEYFKKFKSTIEKVRLIKDDSYLNDRSYEWEYAIILKREGAESARQFSWQNRQIKFLRRMILDELKRNKDWQQYLKIAKEGEEEFKNGNQRMWFRGGWEEDIKLAMKELGDKQGLFQMELENMYRGGFTLKAWKEIKRKAGDEWPKLKASLMKKLSQSENTQPTERLDILVVENEEKQVVAWIKDHPWNSFIDRYSELVRKHLPALYKKRHFEEMDRVRKSNYFSNKEPYIIARTHLNMIQDMLSQAELFTYFQDMERLNSRKKAYAEILRPVLLNLVQSNKIEGSKPN